VHADFSDENMREPLSLRKWERAFMLRELFEIFSQFGAFYYHETFSCFIFVVSEFDSLNFNSFSTF
jgi:hypothetical protein